jgi:hypothetical protein
MSLSSCLIRPNLVVDSGRVALRTLRDDASSAVYLYVRHLAYGDHC